MGRSPAGRLACGPPPTVPRRLHWGAARTLETSPTMSEACPSIRPHRDDPGRQSASVRLGAVVAVLAVVAFGVLGAIAPSSNRAGGATPAPRTPSVSAYWVVASDGGVFSFGGAGFY